MLFNSIEFAVFLVLLLSLYFGLLSAGHERARKCLLLVASYAFYGSWNPFFVLLLAFSTALDFTLGVALERAASRGRRRGYLALSLLGNLGVLAYFKYGGFALDNYHALVGWFEGSATRPSELEIFLPIGISFYTFQTLSYSIDVYRGRMPATRSLLDFALYVSFFPQLVAGPIVRASQFLPQLANPTGPSQADAEHGVMRIVVGLMKKVVIADTLGAYVDVVFASPGSFHGLNVWLAIYAYAYQIYFDFSGYSDIAIGLARLFGLRIPENFDRPYLATSMRDFWRRWHISLSTWLRDYLYISLGGNRRSVARTYFNLLATMLLGGLWHGAAWTFVVWGAYHGLLLVAERAATAIGLDRLAPTRPWLRRIITFHLVCFGWLIFRAQAIGDVPVLLVNAFSFDLIVWRTFSQAVVALLIGAFVHVAIQPYDWHERVAELNPWLKGIVYAAAAVLVSLSADAAGRFIYFQF